MSNDYRFQLEDVQDAVLDPDYGYHDGIDAHVSSRHESGVMTVELTSAEEDTSQRVTERFRVTVERIDPAAEGNDMNDPVYVLAGIIHGSTCEDSPPECIEYEGACVKAAKAVTQSFAGWTVGPSSDGSVEAGLYHSCEPEPVAWMDGEHIASILGAIAEHVCEATR